MSNGRSGGGMWRGRGRGRDGDNDPYGVVGGDDEDPVLRGDPAMPNPPSPDATTGWRDTQLDRPVGPMPYAPNLNPDVAKVQRLMSGAGHYDGAAGEEQGGLYSDALESAIRTYQRDRGLADDGTLMPNGPTVAALKRDLFGRARAGKGEDARAGGLDLRTAATSDEADGDTPRVMRVSDPGDGKRGEQKRIARHNSNILLDGTDDDARDDRQDAQEPRSADAERKNLNLLLEGTPRDKRGQRQLAQNDPEKHNDANPWGNAGDVRRKDNDDLLRMGHGPGVWLIDESDPSRSKLTRYDLSSLQFDKKTGKPQWDTLRPMLDSTGRMVSFNRLYVDSDDASKRHAISTFALNELKALDLSRNELAEMNFSPRRIAAPMLTWQGRFDSQGRMFLGSYRADDPPRAHDGVDLAAPAGTDVVSPIYGVVDQLAILPTDQPYTLYLVRIRGTDDHKGMFARLLYVLPDGIKNGDRVVMGQKIASLGNLARFYPGATKRGMQNHLHFEVHVPGDLDWRLKVIEEDRAIRSKLYKGVKDRQDELEASPVRRPNPYAVDPLKFMLVPDP